MTIVISERELEELALAADPDPEIAPDAVPFGVTTTDGGLLPEWYMPAPGGTTRGPVRRAVIAGIIGTLLLVNGAGLCVTHGWPEIAW